MSGGGKESPRQKMVGMMYLVLTALLAMNVSASILEKFAFLDNGMQVARNVSFGRNTTTINGIKAIVSERGNKPEELALLKESDEIREKTEEILLFIAKLKEGIINGAGGFADGSMAKAEWDNGQLTLLKGKEDVTRKMLPGAKGKDNVMVLMIGPDSKKGKGMELKKRIDEYVQYLNTHADPKHQHESFAYNGKEDPLAKSDPSQASKNFAELNFEETPTVAALAVLSQMQSKLVKYESDVLAEKSANVGASDYKFDIVTIGNKPKSQVVAAGTKYEAELFISATSSALTPKMRWKQYGAKDFTPIDTASVVSGIGTFDFRASGGAYDKDGRSKKKWVGQLEFMGPTGELVTFTDTIEYIVSKPVIQIQSASVSALYLNCGNKLSIQVPALGEDYAPSFGVSGGSKIQGKEKGFVTIVPNSPKVTLSVSSGGTLIGKEVFKVRKIPLPTIAILAKGRKVNLKTGFKSCPRSLDFKAIPDASFKEFLPADARYQVGAGEVSLARGKRVVKKAKISKGRANLSALKGAAKEGDRIIIEIKGVTRRNFQNRSEKVRGLGALIYQIPING